MPDNDNDSDNEGTADSAPATPATKLAASLAAARIQIDEDEILLDYDEDYNISIASDVDMQEDDVKELMINEALRPSTPVNQLKTEKRDRGNMDDDTSTITISSSGDDFQQTVTANMDRESLDFRKMFGLNHDRGNYLRARTSLEGFHTYSFAGNEVTTYSAAYDGFSSYAVALHSKSRIWIQDNNSIPLLDIQKAEKREKGTVMNKSTAPIGFKPTAVAMLKAGCLVVLSQNQIFRCTNEDGVWTHKEIVRWGSDEMDPFRGIAAGSKPEVVFTYAKRGHQIFCFKAAADSHNSVVCFYNYETARYRLNYQTVDFGNVSFIDFNNESGILAMTDLAAQGCISYVSGIKVDANGWLLVMDARGGVLHIFNHELCPVSIIPVKHKEPNPFIAGFALSPHGAIMVSPLRKSRTSNERTKWFMYKFEESGEGGKNLFR
ncbi:unnamed protein product, partial [Mesorhabditis belari]|uniref:Uncharacterized protein n=1 Tax=Mesorhabditis belari TaxID=2138241 RepID=A0AAF3EY56_9BILA